MKQGTALVCDDDWGFRIPAGREHHTSVGNVAERRWLLIQTAHDRCLKALKSTRTGSHIRGKDAESRELHCGSVQDVLFSVLKICSLLRRPSPSVPYLLSDPLLHRRDVKNGVVTAHVFARVFAKSLRNRAAREASRIDQVAAQVLYGLEIHSGMPRNGMLVVCSRESRPAIRPSPYGPKQGLVLGRTHALITPRPLTKRPTAFYRMMPFAAT